MNKKQLKSFELFVSSPYHNTNKEVINLTKYLRSIYPKLNDSKLQKSTVFKKVYGDTAYDDKLLRNVISKSFILLEKFIINEELNNPSSIQTEVLNWWRRKGVYANLDKTSKIILEKLETSKFRDLNYYSTQQKIEEQLYLAALERGTRNIDTNLKVLNEKTDLQFIYHKLKISCELVNRRKVLAKNLDLSLLNPLLEYLDENEDDLNPSINIYYNLIKMLLTDKPFFFHNLKLILSSYSSFFQKEESRDLYGYLNNYCIQSANKGRKGYLKELFELYKQQLDKEILLYKGTRMNLFDYKNIATVAIRLREFEWTKSFTEQYVSFLDEKYRSSALSYNLARIHFYNNEYKHALQQLMGVDYADIYYELGCRSLMIKIHFEEDNWELFQASCQSFQLFIQRNREISEYQKEIYLNFIKYIKRIYSAKNGNKKNQTLLLKDVNNISNTADSTWIQEKIQGLGLVQ
ncbi:MAG: hypothetical protein MRY83_05620 [Flavobacteriales bacterium]|nr:hypothetical protein [Flavobacteriales bacterium]